MPYLPYLAIPEHAHFGGHAIVVYGIENGEALIADRAHGPVRARVEELARARASKFKPFPPQHKLLEVEAPPQPISSQTLERAIVRGISDTCRQLLHGPIQNIGLRALKKWADLVVDERSPKGWQRVFKTPLNLFGALMSTYIFIEIGGTGGSAFRTMYASFLSEAAGVLEQPELERVSCAYRECGHLWSDVARAALPDWVPELKQTRELIWEKNRIFEHQPRCALKCMLNINARHDAIMSATKQQFPLDKKRIPELLGGMREAILRLYTAEVAAAEQLEGCLR
jgi:hypothetical protein